MAEALVSGAVGMASYAAMSKTSSFTTGEARSHSRAKMGRLVAKGMVRRRCVMTLAQDVASPRAAIDPELQETLKREVAKKAVQLIKPGMIVGIGTGSTSCMAIEELAKLINSGKLKDVELLVTSFQASIIARQNKIKTTVLNNVNHVDIAIDGADEIDGSMNLIKGGGAAHTLEKVVDTMAKETIIIADESKIVEKLGVIFPVPVEVLPQAVAPVLNSLARLGGEPEIRSALMKDGAVVTDLGNIMVDVRFPNGVDDPAALEKAINNIPGVVENGLFCGITQKVLVATKDGDEITVIELADFVRSMKSLKE